MREEIHNVLPLVIYLLAYLATRLNMTINNRTTVAILIDITREAGTNTPANNPTTVTIPNRVKTGEFPKIRIPPS
jgi:hypothetical protein